MHNEESIVQHVLPEVGRCLGSRHRLLETDSSGNAALVLISEGQVTHQYFSSSADEINRAVTVRRLLGHTAGFSDGLGFGDYAADEEIPPLEASLTNPCASVTMKTMRDRMTGMEARRPPISMPQTGRHSAGLMTG